jgi:hypothetical protein
MIIWIYGLLEYEIKVDSEVRLYAHTCKIMLFFYLKWKFPSQFVQNLYSGCILVSSMLIVCFMKPEFMNDHTHILLWKCYVFFGGKVWNLSLGLFMCVGYMVVDRFPEFTKDWKPNGYPLNS